MKGILAVSTLAFVIAVTSGGSLAAVPVDPEFIINRPSNTGIPGQSDVMFAQIGPDGRVWVSARDQFWLQGGIGVLDRTTDTWVTYANWQTPLTEWNYDIEFTPDGLVYVAGEGVLARFDGTTWTSFNAGNSPLAGDRLWDLDVDADGDLWVVMDDIDQVQAGLLEYDGTSWTHHDEPFMRTYFGISAPLSVFARSNGDVWAAFEFMSGMAFYDGAGWTHKTGAPALLAMDEAPDGTVYGVSGTGTWRLDDASQTWTQVGSAGSNVIDVDDSGNVWIAANTTEVRVYDGASWNLFSSEPSRVGSIDVQPTGDVWLTTKHQVRHRGPDGTGIRIYNSVNTGMPEYLMQNVYRDRDGNMWFMGAETGTSRFDGTHYRNFSYYNGGEEVFPFLINNGQSLLCEDVQGVLHDSQDNIWFVANGVARSPADDLQNWTLWWSFNANLPSGTLDYIAEDVNGTIWVGHTYGVSRFDGSNWHLHQFGSGFTVNEVEGMGSDSAGNLWVATYAWGLHKWDGTAWTAYTLPHVPRDLAIAPDDTIWIATAGGLVRFDGATMTTYTPANSGLTEDNVSAVAVRQDGLVAATCEDLFNYPYSGSLVFFDGTQWATFAHGSSNYPFYQSHNIEFDRNGDLWIMNVNNGGVRVATGAGPTPGDLNCDGAINAADIDPYVLALTDPVGYATAFPNCDRLAADIDGDGAVNAADIDPFVALVVGG